MKIKKGDTILITRGKDKRKKVKVLRSFPSSGKILAENVNIKKVHKRPKKEGEKGQVVEIPAAIDVSKIKLICPKCAKPTRVGYKFDNKRKIRICKKCQIGRASCRERV